MNISNETQKYNFDNWAKDNIEEYVECFWPGRIQCEELEKYIYDDFLTNYKQTKIDLFKEDYNKIISSSFKYPITKLLFQQILVYPKIVKSFNNVTKNEIWNSLQWLIQLNKIKPEDSLISYKGDN